MPHVRREVRFRIFLHLPERYGKLFIALLRGKNALFILLRFRFQQIKLLQGFFKFNQFVDRFRFAGDGEYLFRETAIRLPGILNNF